jgi:SAM-dependent methyltransferase
MLTFLQYRLLKAIRPSVPDFPPDSFYAGKSKIGVLLGDGLMRRIVGKTVVDFGCGVGTDAIEMAKRGAAHVIGLDIREDVLETGRRHAAALGLSDRCEFATTTKEPADIIVSIDAFEHFADPAGILRIMSRLLRPGGEVFISFGPTWLHPLGGHLFSIFPWAHLLFGERALIRWRADFKSDGATRFGEVAGGLNQMTIARFEALVLESPFTMGGLELVPIGKLRPVHSRITREFTTALVRCRLTRKSE